MHKSIPEIEMCLCFPVTTTTFFRFLLFLYDSYHDFVFRCRRSLSLSLYVKRNSYGSSTMEKNANGRLFLLRSDKPCSICQRMAVVPDVNKSAHTFYAFTILSCSRNSLRGRFKRAGYSRWLQPRRISRSHLQLVSFYLYSRDHSRKVKESFVLLNVGFKVV